uniref:Uncharacterized protein n=1 Tax=Solanum lycopersicum TaxID=4081 RepID=K4C0N8_SOLLC
MPLIDPGATPALLQGQDVATLLVPNNRMENFQKY